MASGAAAGSAFQFHKGTIKTRRTNQQPIKIYISIP